MVLVLWRRGAAAFCEGARGDPAVRAGRRVRRAAAAKCQTPLQRRRRQQPAARRPSCRARQPFFGRSDGVEARAPMLSSLQSHLMLRSLGTNACCALALSGLDLSNPTSLRFDLAAFSCFRGPGTPPPRSRRRSAREPSSCPSLGAARCEPVTRAKTRKRHRAKGDKDHGAARTAARRRCGPSNRLLRS